MLIRLACLLLLFGFFAHGDPAAADEMFELKNGVVVRGYVMREEGERLTIRLTGFTRPSTVTIDRKQIVQRRPVGIPTSSTHPVAQPVYAPQSRYVPPDNPVTVATRGHDVPSRARPPSAFAHETLDEPGIEEEPFFHRFVRLTRVALPDSMHARLTLGAMLILVLTLLIGAGGRLTEMDGVSLIAAAGLAVLFAGALVTNLYAYESVLRADRAVWVLPLEMVAWIGIAKIVLGGSIGRATLIFAFTLVGLLTVVFATGAIFVTV